MTLGVPAAGEEDLVESKDSPDIDVVVVLVVVLVDEEEAEESEALLVLLDTIPLPPLLNRSVRAYSPSDVAVGGI